MGKKSIKFEGKIRNDFSIKISHLNSLWFLLCRVVSRSNRGNFMEFQFQQFLSIYIDREAIRTEELMFILQRSTQIIELGLPVVCYMVHSI